MSEFAPPWSNARMTKAQVRKYIKDLEEKRRLAKQKLEEAKARWEFDESADLEKLEEALDNL